ncbi:MULTISPECIES: SusC/RagA family TonB-linked outer membrane protein [Niastella]|uniref:SusC/RagA family TonB-linked outer membrane protein n=1 Tax=Niastella soli TaxID=2821487 RepID=A0ABS3Z3G2_9BACT|nr:SusC/RagA family TonB-linked outer membrane protein [Niastella soli]MBO9204705.1 SusC/RagA family TonB-linked outer membrane protein [Niastella soli]
MRPKYNLVRTGLVWLVLMMVGAAAIAQQKTIEVIKGTVKTEDGALLGGASVSVPGTAISVNTKRDGFFELHNVPEGAMIRVTFVSFNTYEVKLKPGQTSLNITMTVPNTLMDQVTVNVGLYKRPQGNFTGAARALTGEELKTVNPTNVLKAIAALDPSVRIAENNALGSDPNNLPNLQIRGQNNLPVNLQNGSASGVTSTAVSNGDIMSGYLQNPNQPLIVLDGFQTTLQTIYDMDINRIASVTILKDAAATTAYGSKAANGVIVIETKAPVQGKTQVSYAVNFNLQAPDLSSYNLLDAEGILEAQRLSGIYTDKANQYRDVALHQWYDYRLQQVRSGVNTYWLNKPVRTGLGTNHSLTLSGGSKFTRYTLSLNYNNSVGVMKGSERKVFGLNNQIIYSKNKIRFINNTNVNYGKGNNSPWGTFNEYASQFPFFKAYDSTGNFAKMLEPANTQVGIGTALQGAPFTNAAYNALLNVIDYSYYYSLGNRSAFEWTIANGLRMSTSLSINMNLPGAEQFFPPDHTSFAKSNGSTGFIDLGSYSQTRGSNNVVDGRWNMDYNKKIGDHSFIASAGVTLQSTNTSATTVKVTGIPYDNMTELGFANGYGQATRPGSNKATTRTLSSYLSVSYNYLNRYTLEVTGNASGSSQFGSNNRLAPFWAVGGSWAVDREPFFPKNPVIQQLKVRATTGIAGNQNFAASMGQSVYLYNLTNNYRLQLGATVNGYANPDLKWQQTLKNNLGITAVLFNGKINVGVEIYDERTNNLILPLEIAPSTGFVNYQNNLGATKTTGYEVNINAPIIRNKAQNIYWSVFGNVGHTSTVVTRLSPAIELINKANNKNTSDDAKLQSAPLPRYETGQSLSRIWVVKSLGIDPATGKEVYEKRDGSQTFTWDPADKRPMGDVTPLLKGMFGTNVIFKGFFINLNCAFQYGSQLYNQTLVDKVENVNLNNTNADKRVLNDRWKQPGDRASFKALTIDGSAYNQITKSTSRFLQDDNYIAASSVSVGYTFPAGLGWVKRLHLSTPRLAITQNDAFRFATIKTERGTSYPFARSYSFGLSTSF